MASVRRLVGLLLAAAAVMCGCGIVAVPAAAAANGGAAPPPSSASASETNGGGTANGGAEPGVAPDRVAAKPSARPTSRRTGGAKPGATPAQAKRAKPKTASSKAKAKKRKPAAKTAPKRQAASSPGAGSGSEAAPTSAGTFPLLGGDWSFGGSDARFGAGRTGHIHQGQDVIAPERTPIVAPVAGTIIWTANQPAGGGLYAVLHGTDGRDYVFMHMRTGTLLVQPDDVVRAGQQLGQVGHTGDASGPHLHFEIWVGGWYAKGGQPIDPLPQLQAWAAGRGG